MAEDASATKFLVSSFMNYKMVDNRPLMEQYQEMLRIMGQYTQHYLMMDEAISVAVIIDKLPPSWKEFKHGLKHKKEELNLVQLGSHLRIEKGLRNQELDNNPKGKNQIGLSSVNMVERDGAKNSNNNKNKRKFKSDDDKFANKKGTITCRKCKKTGHMKKDCRSRKGNDSTGSNGSKDPKKQQGYNSDFMQNFVNVLHYVFVISDAFYVQDDEVAWWVDSGATIHVCKDLRCFQVCKSIEDGSFVKMRNIATEPIKGIRRVLLTFNSGKTLCLDNVLYVLGIRKNIVSEIVLNKCGYKQVLESDKYCYVYILHAKHEALDKSKVYKQEVELQRQDLIKVLRTDRGGEYYDPVFLQLTGIIHQTMTPYTPQQNGVAERKNMTLKEMVNSMLSYYGLSEGFWGKAMFYVIAPNDYISMNSIIESRDVIFDEERFTSIPRPKGMIRPSLSKIAEDEVEGIDDVPGLSVLRKSTRTRKAKSFGSDFQLYLVEGTRDKNLSQREYCFIIEEDPRTMSEAMASRDVAFWKEAVQSEVDSIMHNDTWEKMKVDGSIDKYKSRLVIQDFRQKDGINFFDTYALVARISTIRLLLVLAAIHDLVIHQMDVKTAFLNGDLDEEFYMKQPEGFVMSGHERVIICLYVDDMLIFGTDQDQVNKTKEFLSSKFDIIDLGEAEVILGIKIKRGNNDPTVKFRHNNETLVSQLEYSRVIGCLMYAMISTRPDIAFAKGKLSRYTSNPSALHWQALGRVFQYLKRTMDYGLTYSGNPSVIEGSSDANWINNMEDHSCDSVATLAKAYSQVYNGKSRHLVVRHSMIHELIMNGVISVEFVRTQLNLAYHLTKGLARDLVRKAAIGMGLKST
nr:hypothetical protein [Tanacetum cinerariifolium]